VLTRARCVVFDCDSTLCAIEGIDELADAHREAIEELTAAAMRGELPLEDVYGRRLEIIRPGRDAVQALGRLYVERLVPDAREVVAALRREGVAVRIMSGGLRPAVEAAAAALGLTQDAVAAVDIHFAQDGSYAGFEADSPLARSGGKLEVMQSVRRQEGGPLIMVGDGITDLEARPAVEMFVAYAGVVERPQVVAAADIVIRSASMAPVLPLALGGTPAGSDEVARLARRGMELLEPRYRALLTENTVEDRITE
jgi:phosphoserine phosphatase